MTFHLTASAFQTVRASSEDNNPTSSVDVLLFGCVRMFSSFMMEGLHIYTVRHRLTHLGFPTRRRHSTEHESSQLRVFSYFLKDSLLSSKFLSPKNLPILFRYDWASKTVIRPTFRDPLLPHHTFGPIRIFGGSDTSP